MAHNLTRRQFEVLQAIRRLAEEQHYMPSVRELGAELELSPATIQQHLRALDRKGYLRTDGKAHGLRLLADDDQRANSPETKSAAVVSIPVVGTIAAGSPIEAIEVVERTLPLAGDMAAPGDYLLHVRGDSMVEDGILDGDLVLIRPQRSVKNGETAVGLLEDGTATLKRVYLEENRIRLQPANRTMGPIYVKELRIQGRVVGLVRVYD